MSADNRICIMRDWGGEWRMWHGSGSCDYHEPPCGSVRFESLDEALSEARKQAEGMTILEYGIQVIGVDEQRVALEAEIVHLGKRLALLNATGDQFKRYDDDGDRRA